MNAEQYCICYVSTNDTNRIEYNRNYIYVSKKFNSEICYNLIKEKFQTHVEMGLIIISTLRHSPVFIHWITSLNVYPHLHTQNIRSKGIQLCDMSVEYRINDFIINTPDLDYNEHYLQSILKLNGTAYTIKHVQKFHNLYWTSIRFKWTNYKNQFNISEKITNADSYHEWQKNMFSAFLKIAEQTENNEVTVAPKMIYLHGRSRCGKSSTINMCCDNEYFIYRPANNPTWLSGFNST